MRSFVPMRGALQPGRSRLLTGRLGEIPPGIGQCNLGLRVFGLTLQLMLGQGFDIRLRSLGQVRQPLIPVITNEAMPSPNNRVGRLVVWIRMQFGTCRLHFVPTLLNRFHLLTTLSRFAAKGTARGALASLAHDRRKRIGQIESLFVQGIVDDRGRTDQQCPNLIFVGHLLGHAVEQVGLRSEPVDFEPLGNLIHQLQRAHCLTHFGSQFGGSTQ